MYQAPQFQQISQYQQAPQLQQSAMFSSPQFAPVPYYYPVMNFQPIPQQMLGMNMQPNVMMNGNQGFNNQQFMQQNGNQQNSELNKKRAQSQNKLQFEDSLDREKLKFQSAQLNNKKGDNNNIYQQVQSQSNIFKPGNHSSHFNPKSVTDLILDKQKKNQYANQLNQQLKTKKEVELEKKVLDTKSNIHLFIERSKNETLNYNMPIRDQYGNILQSRGQPGNRNYEIQDWFTHVPNINRKFAQEDDIQLMEYSRKRQLENSQNNNMQQFNAFQKQQEALLNFENKHKKQIKFSFNDDAEKQSLIINNNYNQYNQNNMNSKLQHNSINERQSHNNLYSAKQNIDDDLDEYENEKDIDEQDEEINVRIKTPVQSRLTTKKKYMPQSQEEIGYEPTSQGHDLYSSHVAKSQNDMNYIPSLQRIPSSYSKAPASLTYIPSSSARITQLQKQDYKYVNQMEKMKKREIAIQLQNEQIYQMEEKKRQKELAKIQEKREKDLEDLRISREQNQIQEKFFQDFNEPTHKRHLKESHVQDQNLAYSYKQPKSISLSNFDAESSSNIKSKRLIAPVMELDGETEQTQKYNNFDPEQLKNELGSMLFGGQKVSSQTNISQNNIGINNRINYLTYEDGFEKSSKEVLNNQQQRIEDRLNRLGLQDSSQTKLPSIIF